MRIYCVQCLPTGTAVLLIDADPAESIHAVREKVRQASGGRRGRHPLTYAGIVLHDSHTLSECNVQPEDTLFEMTSRMWFASRRVPPLHWAAYEGHLHAIELLSRLHPDGGFVGDSHGVLPLHQAADQGHVKAIELILRLWPRCLKLHETSSGCTAIHFAARSGSVEALEVLLRLWPDGAMTVNMFGRTPLFQAAEGGHFPALEVLTRSCPAALRRRDTHGATAFHHADARSHDRLMESMMSYLEANALRVPTTSVGTDP